MSKRVFSRIKDINIQELINFFSDRRLNYIKIAILFGSRAKKTHHIQSDYDFAVVFNFDSEINNIAWGYMSKAWNDIGDVLNLHESDYDVIDFKKADELITKSIKESYCILKGDNDDIQRLLNKYE